jgi:hypothetical protein
MDQPDEPDINVPDEPDINVPDQQARPVTPPVGMYTLLVALDVHVYTHITKVYVASILRVV